MRSKASSPKTDKQTPPKSGAERREDILSAARDLFYSRGFETGSMRELAVYLNFTQAALYYHFKSKDEILFNVLEHFTSHMLTSLSESLDAEPSIVGLCNTIRLHVTISRQYTKDVKLLIEDRKLLSTVSSKAIENKEREIFDLYREKIKLLIKSGDLRSVSPVVLTFTLLAAVNGVYQWYDSKGPLDIDEIADQILRILLGGIVTDRARKQLPTDLAKLLRAP
jgi:TetR/AcrR family transcriptional regulator, cholesterol catabolism regulator